LQLICLGCLADSPHCGVDTQMIWPPAVVKRYADDANPNAEPIEQTTKAGAGVRLCGQSMVALGFTRDELNPDVGVDTSDSTTKGKLLMRRYGLIQD
jgi:intracellular sulfur oxidation DsrE/DsrF family protein